MTRPTGYQAADGRWIEIPPRAVPGHGVLGPVPAGLHARWTQAIREEHKQRYEAEQRPLEASGATNPRSPGVRLAMPASALGRAILREAAAGQPAMAEWVARLDALIGDADNPAVAPEDLAPADALTVSVLFIEFVRLPVPGFDTGIWSTWLYEWLRGPSGDLREVEDRLVAMGVIDPEEERQAVIDALVVNGPVDYDYQSLGKVRSGHLLRVALGWDRYLFDWMWLRGVASDAIWPYYAENLEELLAAFGPWENPWEAKDPRAVLRAVAPFPALPAALEPAIRTLALAGKADVRKRARRLLEPLPDIETRLLAELGSTSLVRRSAAALWLADLGSQPAIEPLKSLLAKEKAPKARASAIQALTRLGADVSPWTGPDALVSDARAALKKGMPKGLEWLQLDQAPPLRFADGRQAPPELLEGWVAITVKLKDAGAVDLTAPLLDVLMPEDALSLGRWILHSLISTDTARLSLEALNAEVDQIMQGFRGAPEHAAFERGFVYQRLRSKYQNNVGTHRGMLALCAKVPPREILQLTLDTARNHPARLTLMEGLCGLMAGLEHPITLQGLATLARTAKHDAIRKLASRASDTVAARHGWTSDELQDRTVPDCGFDSSGRLDLPVGAAGAIWSAVLQDDLMIALRRPDGTSASSLPTTQDETTTAARATLKEAKAAIDEAVGIQRVRLLDAMCAAASWEADLWRRLFQDHPVSGKLATRVVFQAAVPGEAQPLLFRPTAERELVDAEGDPVTLPEAAEVSIAHASQLDLSAIAAWRRHLEDFEVTPLLPQFDELLAAVSAQTGPGPTVMQSGQAVKDRATFVALARAMGYSAPRAYEGTMFFSLPMPRCGVTAQLFVAQMDGSGGNQVCLQQISLARLTADETSDEPLSLDALPAVLRAEIMRQGQVLG